MKVGTKSVLFGVHAFWLHPFFVALAWWKLYGFPWDPRLWVAFFVHDIGYFGKPDMDGEEGETHVFLGAEIMGYLFDKPYGRKYYLKRPNSVPHRDWPDDKSGTWYCFTFFHSRFMAKRYGSRYSRLCVADKLATVLTPSWIYIPMACLTGEIHEYRQKAEQMNPGTRAQYATSHTQWLNAVKNYLRDWTAEFKDGKHDTWTKDRTPIDETGCYQ